MRLEPRVAAKFKRVGQSAANFSRAFQIVF